MTDGPAAPEPLPGAPRPGDETGRAGRLLFAGSLVGKLMRLGTDLMLGRVLGPAGFGVVSAASSLVFVLGEVGLLGMQRAVLRFASEHESEGRAVDAAAIARRGILFPVAVGAALFLAILLARGPLARLFFDASVPIWILPAFAATIPVFGAFTVLQFAARAGRRFGDDVAIGNLGQMGFGLVATAALLGAGFGLAGAAVAFVLGMVATLLLAVVLARRATHRARDGAGPADAPAPAVPGTRALLRVGLPLALASSAILLVNEMDKVMLAMFRPEEEVGLYTAAFRISRQANLLLPALMASVSPWVAPLVAQGRLDDLRDLYRQTTRWSLAVGATSFLVFLVFGRDFLALFDRSFLAAAGLLLVLAAGQLVIAAIGSAPMLLQFSGRERLELHNGLVVTGVNIALNIALIPRWGASGAALATAISLVLVSVRRLLQVRGFLGILPWDGRTLRVLAGVPVALATAWLARAGVGALGAPLVVALLAILVGALAGWALFFRVAGIDPEDAALLRFPRRWTRSRGRP